MSDQSQPDPKDLATAPVIGGEGNEPEIDTTDLDLSEIGGDAATDKGEEELDELDFGYKKWRVPKELKEGVEKLNAAHTQSSQETASKAADLEAREARLTEQSKLSQEEMLTRVSLSNIETRLEQYGKLTETQWSEMKETNYEAWNEHRLNVISLQNARSEAQGKLAEHETKRSESAEKEYATRIQQTQEFASKLPGWKPELDKQVVEFALSKGFKPEEITRNMSPAIYDTLRLARIGAAVEKQQAKRAKEAAATPAEPLEMVGTKKSPPPAGLDDRLSPSEWLRRRNAQLAKAH